jgi:uncharacterized membrane protein YedE/YeeE
MKKQLDRIRPLLFILGGIVVGLGYYYVVGCAGGTCAAASDPMKTVIYMGLVGFILSGVLGKGCDCGCNT